MGNKKKKEEKSLHPFDVWPPLPDKEAKEEDKKPSERLPRNRSYLAPQEDELHQDHPDPVYEGEAEREEREEEESRENEKDKEDKNR